MFTSLLTSRRFWPLFWCQFFSAFNDNFVRNMLAMLILFRLGAEQTGALVTLAIGIFVLPSIVLSAPGGEIADAHDKALVARRLKFAEIFVQMVAAAGFWFGSLALLYAALFGLGVIAALFGPIKYGILPDHLKTEELPAGNALIEGATFVAILLGIIVGGYAASHDRAPSGVVVQLVVIALACWLTSRFIPPTPVAAPGLRVDRNIARSTWRLASQLREDRRIWTGGLAVSWFWMTGAVCLSLVPVLIKHRIGGGIDVETAINALFAIGIAVGSIGAALVAHGRIVLWPVPLAALAMAGFLLDLGWTTFGLAGATHDVNVAAFLASANGIRIAVDVAGIAVAGGFFVVPAFAAVQAWAGVDRRARVVAAVNIVTSLFMVGGALTTAVLQGAFGIGEPALLMVLGGLNVAAAAWFYARLPR